MWVRAGMCVLGLIMSQIDDIKKKTKKKNTPLLVLQL